MKLMMSGGPRWLGILGLTAALVAAVPGHVYADQGDGNGAQTIVVAQDKSQCPNAQFSTIQSAVTAARASATIVVCPGTYVEQVTIPATKNGLTLVSKKPLAAIIQAPPAMTTPKAIVRDNGAKDVTIRDFTITGPGGGGCDSLEYGVRVDTNGSAALLKNHITQIRDQPFGGCQNGIAVEIGRDHPGTLGDPADVTSATAQITGNTIDNYQKGGIEVGNTGSSADINNNVVTGVGPTAAIAANGIQVSDGATTEIHQNVVSGNVYTPGTVTSTGILLFAAGNVQVDDNPLPNNDTGIYAFQTPWVTITQNEITKSTFAGIIVQESNSASVENNTTSGATAAPTAVPGNGGGGIQLYTTTGATISHNKANNNAEFGLYADSASTNNTFTHNQATGNGVDDARDDSRDSKTAGTANTWENNNCNTSSPSGLCSN